MDYWLYETEIQRDELFEPVVDARNEALGDFINRMSSRDADVRARFDHDDHRPVAGRFEFLDDDFFLDVPSPPHGSSGKDVFREATDTVDDVDVIGERRMTDEEINEILDSYNPNDVGPVGTGNGGGGNHVPNNLSGYSCEDLAFWENQLEDNISQGQSFAIAALSLTGDFFRGQQAFQEIYSAFSNLASSGQYRDDDPFSNVAAVFAAVRDPNGILAATLLGLGLSAGIEYGILSIVETVFRNQRDLDRINAEQASRGSGCGG